MKTVMLSGRFCMFAITLFAATCPANAGVPGWFDSRYSYVLIDQDVRDALQEFGRNLSVPVLLSDKIRGQVRGDVRADTAGGFLDKLTRANGLVWYFDGSVLHVNTNDEVSTQIINIGRANGDAVIAEIHRLDLMDDRFSVRATANAPVLRVSGPPPFIAMVKQVAASVQPSPSARMDDPRVRIFRGGQHEEVADDLTDKAATTTANARTNQTAAGEQ